MSVDSLDPQLQTLYNLLKSEIDPLRKDITVMNNSINRIHETLESQNIFFRGFMEDTRNRLNELERKTA
jgi:hypothetical protein